MIQAFTLLLMLAVFSPSQVWAQAEIDLANQYFDQGEFEKAAELYSELYAAAPRNEYFFNRYLESLTNARAYEAADKAIKKALKDNPANVYLYVTKGQMLEEQGESDQAKEAFEDAIDKLPNDRFSIQKVAHAFSRASKLKYAIRAYERGAELMQDPSFFAYNLGTLYQQVDDEEGMIRNYLLSLRDKPERLGSVQNAMARNLDNEGYGKLQTQIFRDLQGRPDDDTLIELLVWTFIQQKDYRSAMRQVKALDIRKEEDGMRIFQLAITAMNERQYLAAQDGFAYIIEEKGRRSPYYIESRRLMLDAERERLLALPQYDKEAFEGLEQRYEQYLQEDGLNSATAMIAHELALLKGYQLDKREEAISILDSLLNFSMNPDFVARVKLDLADFYLIQGDRWESTLLYSQVDKAFPEAQLGHEARYRNARLSYYAGDFQWAQQQFDILKSSTSRLIANDAIDMSVFIMDNLNLDTTSTPLSMYASAELLIFQYQFPEATNKLDSILFQYPGHELQDDVVFAKAQIAQRKGNFQEAALIYAELVDQYPDAIRADNALFALAEITETKLGDTAKAMELYEKLFVEYDSSILAVEARKRFRKLRGDQLG